jgi:signal transduction histidine kinase
MTPAASRTSRVSLVTLGGGVAIAAVVVSVLVLGAPHTLIVVGVLAGIALVTLTGTELLVRRRGGGRSLSVQLALLIGLVIGPLLVGFVVLGMMMFVSHKDAALVAVILALTGVLGVTAAWRVARAVAADELAAREQAEAARRGLVAAASHDLRTPITSLRLLAQAVDDELVEGPIRREYVGRMLTHIEALSALIDDLFELSRLEAGDIQWSLEQVALSDLVAETVDAMQVQADARGIAVHAEVPASLALARGNPEKLQRVLFNLIQNAIRHSPADGSVVVRAETLHDVIEVEVSDQGDGIPVSDRELVFDAFYRGDESRPSDGAGLGLAVARAIVEAHGGRIWLPATPSGTRVRFSVPVAG